MGGFFSKQSDVSLVNRPPSLFRQELVNIFKQGSNRITTKHIGDGLLWMSTDDFKEALAWGQDAVGRYFFSLHFKRKTPIKIEIPHYIAAHYTSSIPDDIVEFFKDPIITLTICERGHGHTPIGDEIWIGFQSPSFNGQSFSPSYIINGIPEIQDSVREISDRDYEFIFNLLKGTHPLLEIYNA
jgi:hypothetical protein